MTNRLAYPALAAVCFFWGTTYLGIRVGLEGLAPFYLIAIGLHLALARRLSRDRGVLP